MATNEAMILGAAVILLIPWVSSQATQCAPDGYPQLRFVAQLSVSGCPLFVHDTGASDGLHLAVEPIMCVTQSLHNVTPRYDPVTQQTYVSVPVTLRDDAMLAEVQHQLRHLSPKSVKFATVTAISVPAYAAPKFQALEFDWIPGESAGILMLGLGCEDKEDKFSAIRCLSNTYRTPELAGLSHALLTATTVGSNGPIGNLKYRIMLQNESYLDPMINSQRYFLPSCQQLRFIRSIHLNNCTARVHQRLDIKGHFLIEPLLCNNITSLSNQSVMYDYSRDKYYLKLDVVLQDDMTMNAVKTQLADFSPRSVTFMRLWRAQSHVASAVSRRFEIGPLMVSVDGKSAQLRVFCSNLEECNGLRRSALEDSSFSLWRKIRDKWTVTSQLDLKCIVTSSVPTRVGLLAAGEVRKQVSIFLATSDWNRFWMDRRQTVHQFLRQSGDRKFVVIQQRQTGNVSFQRTWKEYETGFGDDADFWIGLSTIHSLSLNGATLRVEMKLWDGSELHAEYAGFKVGDASTNYKMTYKRLLRDRSSIRLDAITRHDVRGMKFSTMDRDNDRHHSSCSNLYGGRGGWWFRYCSNFNPNGVYGGDPIESSMNWNSGRWQRLREVRLMLEI